MTLRKIIKFILFILGKKNSSFYGLPYKTKNIYVVIYRIVLPITGGLFLLSGLVPGVNKGQKWEHPVWGHLCGLGRTLMVLGSFFENRTGRNRDHNLGFLPC